MMLNQNKQKMYYANFTGDIPRYVYDENGEKIVDYIDDDGNKYYRETGEPILGYDIPHKMLANISFGSNEITAQEFGVDKSDYDAVVVYARGEYDLNETSRLWYETKPNENTVTEGVIGGNSADYSVVSIRHSLNETKAILRHLTK